MRKWITVAFAATLLGGCSEELVRPMASQPRFDSGVCTDTGPTEPGCPVQIIFNEYEDDMAQDAGAATGAESLWSGQADLSAFADPYSCPDQITLARNKVYIPEYGEDATFLVTNLNKVSNDGYGGLGQPMATYAVGPRSFNSVVPLGKYKMYGGFMKARCTIKTVRTQAGIRVMVGAILWYDYQGEIDLASNSAGGGDDTRGWAYSNNGSQSGMGNGGPTPQSVINRLLGGGGCTVGWEVWIDGAMACDAKGNAQ